jgi:hypothetical protein
MAKDEWVLLAYRLPRLPSTPRSAIWRKLKRLGVAQLSDGLVALSADARTREALGWIGDEVIDYGGEASVWMGRPTDAAGPEAIRARMSAAVAAEYDTVAAEAVATLAADAATRRRVVARLRRELHRIQERDFFAVPEADRARRGVEDLAAETGATTSAAGVRR